MSFLYFAGQKHLIIVVEAVLCWIGFCRLDTVGQAWMRSSRVVNAKVATVLGSTPAFSDTVESEGRQMRQYWITKKKVKKSSVLQCWIFSFDKKSDFSILNFNFLSSNPLDTDPEPHWNQCRSTTLSRVIIILSLSSAFWKEVQIQSGCRRNKKNSGASLCFFPGADFLFPTGGA